MPTQCWHRSISVLHVLLYTTYCYILKGTRILECGVCVYPRAQAVAAAFVGQMEEEANKLRDAKSALESALSKGEALSDATVALSDANKAYHTASLQVRKNCSQPKPKAKAKAAA